MPSKPRPAKKQEQEVLVSNKEAWADAIRYSGDFSEIGRRASYAGIATFWIITNSSLPVNDYLKFSLFLFLSFIFFDAIQMFFAFLIRRNDVEKKEKAGEKEFTYSNTLDDFAFCLFKIKGTALFLAFGSLALYLWCG